MEILPSRPRSKDQILKKHVAAIQARAELSFLQRKLTNALLYNAYDGLMTEPEHAIDAAVLCEMIGFDSKNISYLKAALKGLMETVVEFDVFEDGATSWEAMSLLSYASIKSGVCRYRYDRSLCEKLYHPDVYSKINLSVLREMKSSHALVLYENCYRYVDVGQTPWWDVEMFRKLMAVDTKPSYKPFKALNRNVIQPAIKEVNKLSNIQVSMETRVKGRTVTGLQFTVKANPQLSLLSMDDQDEIASSKAYQALRKEGISMKLARKWALEHTEEYILEKIELARDEDLGGRIKKSKAGFLKAAIEDDYHSEKAAQKQANEAALQRSNKKAQLEKRLSELTGARKDFELSYRRKSVEAIQGRLEGLPDPLQAECSQRFIEFLDGHEILIRSFRKESWASLLVFAKALEFWHSEGLSLPSHEEFAKANKLKTAAELSAEIEEIEVQLKNVFAARDVT